MEAPSSLATALPPMHFLFLSFFLLMIYVFTWGGGAEGEREP